MHGDSAGRNEDNYVQELAKSVSPIVKAIAALGLGLIQDEKTLPILERLLQEQEELVSGAAMFALGQFTNVNATKLVLDQLLAGPEDVKVMAASALAGSSDGQDILNAIKTPDILVRRAIVQSISQIHASWVNPFLTQISLEDDQWIVRNAAVNALEQMQDSTHLTPRSLPPPAESNWLIQAASKKGVSIPKGRPPTAFLISLLNSNTLEEELAAMDYLKWIPEKEVVENLEQKIQRD